MNEFDEFFMPDGPVQVLNATENAPLLMGTAKPGILLKTERPSHRLVAEGMAAGFTQKEMSQQLNVSEACVSVIARQPHVQQNIVNSIQQNISQDHRVVEIIKDSVVSAVQLLADVVKNKECRTTDRIAAAEKLLERRYGKANQPINRGTEVDLNSLDDSALAAMLPTDSTGTSAERSEVHRNSD
jgi:hypothetical protein